MNDFDIHDTGRCPWQSFASIFIALAVAGAFSGGDLTANTADAMPADRTTEKALVQAYHDRSEFDGVVLVAEGNKIHCLEAAGTVSAEPGAAAITPQTVFPICSITKQFTAVLILQLVDEGKLRLDSPLSEALPGFRTDDAGKSITVRQLLLHTSGLPNLDKVLPEEDGVAGFYRVLELDYTDPMTVLRIYISGPLAAAPGERFDYNNADYWVLGVIIEHFAGKSYDTLLNERFFGPLGMTHSGLCTPLRPLPPGSAQGKTVDPKGSKPKPGPFFRLENFWAAGGAFSTAEDMLRWSVALDEGKLLSPAMQTAMFTPDPKLGFAALSTWVYNTTVPGVEGKVLLAERQGEIEANHALSLRLPQQHGHILVFSNLAEADLNSTYMGKGLPFDLVQAFLTSVPAKPTP